jgi:hypothetical protein
LDNDDYYNEIELILRQILQPIEKISFSTFIRVISGYKVIPLDLSTNKDRKLIDDLIKASNKVINDIKNTGGIKTKDGKTPKRVNEVGIILSSMLKMHYQSMAMQPHQKQKLAIAKQQVILTLNFGTVEKTKMMVELYISK